MHDSMSPDTQERADEERAVFMDTVLILLAGVLGVMAIVFSELFDGCNMRAENTGANHSSQWRGISSVAKRPADEDAKVRYERQLVCDAILQIVIGMLVVAMLSVFVASYFLIFRYVEVRAARIRGHFAPSVWSYISAEVPRGDQRADLMCGSRWTWAAPSVSCKS